MASSAAPTPSEYIVHHLGHLNSSGKPQDTILNMSIINYDTLFWSISMAMLTAFVFWRIAKSFSSGVPTRMQAMAEMVFELVDEQAKSIVPSEKSRLFVVPLAMAVFVWIILMNSLDLLPLDLPHYLFALTGLDKVIHYHRIVPTADLNGTIGMSLGVLILMFYYNVKIKGAGGFVSELFTAPFHGHGFMAVLLAPVNFLLNLIEFAAKSVSLGMRLFGNMFAGELVFMLIALMGAAWTGFNFASIALGVGHFLAGLGWAIFHILIVLLQAFIFMMLTLVYIGQAHEGH